MRVLSRAVLIVGAISLLASCAATPIRKVSSEEGRVRITAGPPAEFSITQVLTSITEVRWTLSAGKTRETRKKTSGLKLLASFQAQKREGSKVTFSVDLREVKILKGNSFITAPFAQFSPPNPITMVVDYEKGTVTFPELSESYRDWANGLKGTPVWDVMGRAFDVDAFVSQLEDLLRTPAADFAGKELLLGEKLRERESFHLPFLGPNLSLGPVEATRTLTLKGMLETAGTRLALIEGTLHSTELRMSRETLSERLAGLGFEAPERVDSEGELGGRIRARVDAATGWAVQDSRKIHSITIVKFSDGYFKEEILGRKNAYETD